MDFSHEDTLDAIDRIVAQLLTRAGVTAPPISARAIAEEHLGIPVEVVDPVEEDDHGRRRPRTRPRSTGIVLSPDMTPEQENSVAANGVARSLLPDLFRKLDIPEGAESKPMIAHFRGLMAAHLLIPTRMLRIALKECKYDVPALKQVFATATEEAVALRLLDLDDPCVIAVIDDGVVAVRRSNRMAATRKLTPAEQSCLDEIMHLDAPHATRLDGWSVSGWPIPNRPFRRIILRAVPDDV